MQPNSVQEQGVNTAFLSSLGKISTLTPRLLHDFPSPLGINVSECHLKASEKLIPEGSFVLNIKPKYGVLSRPPVPLNLA